MKSKNLWPDNFAPSDELTPETILGVQAEGLNDKTSGKLTARVDIGTIGPRISLDFMIVAPALNGYEYRLFKVLHDVHPAFKASFIVSDEKPVTVRTQEEFETELARILRSETTVRLIAELLELIDQSKKGRGKKKS